MALDILRSQALEGFLKEQEFDSNNVDSFDAITIHKASSLGFRQDKVPAGDVVSWCEQGPSIPGEFRLLRIDRKRGQFSNTRRLLIDKGTFMACFEAFGLDQWFLYLLQNQSYSVEYFRKESIPNTSTAPKEVYFVNTIAFALLWSYGYRDASTSAILFPRDITNVCNDFWKADDTYKHFVDHLMRFRDFINDPCLLLSLSCVETIQWMYLYTKAYLKDIQEVEFNTRHSTWKGDGRTAPGIEKLNIMSMSMGKVLSGLCDVTRHVVTVQTIFNHIRNHQLPLEADMGWSDPKLFLPQREEFKQLIHVHQNCLQDIDKLNVYLQDRARTQLSVIFNLLAREDANANYRVAQAAKEDSSAMKTIAVMTMLFLPATFFAALFSVPSLQWSATSIISDRFWIYWAFTIPCTVMVFAAWLLILNRRRILRYLQQLPKDDKIMKQC